MSDFLSRLAARTLGLAPVAQPVVPGTYAGGTAQMELRPLILEIDKPQVKFLPATEGHPNQNDSTPQLAVTPETPLVSAKNAAARTEKHDVSDALSPRLWNQENEFEKTSPTQLHPECNIVAGPPVAPKTSTMPCAESPVRAASSASPDDGYERLVAALASPRRELTAETSLPPVRPASLPAGPVHADRPAQEAPVIRVHIGRVEVRAEFPLTAARSAARRSQSPSLSLDEYARQRKEGLR